MCLVCPVTRHLNRAKCPYILFNQIGSIFKPNEEAQEEVESLQAALSAQVRKNNFEHRGAAVHHDSSVPKKNQESRSPNPESSDIAKLTQVVFNRKAEMGAMRKEMMKAGISFDRSPNKPGLREQAAYGKQRG